MIIIAIECEYGFGYCANDSKCYLCIDGNQYKEVIEKKRSYLKKNNNKKSNRMGSNFEITNHRNNQKAIAQVTESNMTPNSGAGRIKGDEQIRGLVNVMEELKTQEDERARGHKQFTIKREHLEKLEKEAKQAGMEFYYLKFAFKDSDNESYTVIDSNQLMDMILTLIHDRKIANEAELKISIANKRKDVIEAENKKLIIEIDYLKTLLKQHNINIEI